MKHRTISKYLFVGIIISLLIVGCQAAVDSEPIPTLMPLAEIPTQIGEAVTLATEIPATETILPPTYDFHQLNPTAVPTESPTPRPTATNTPVAAALTITSPEPEAKLIIGREFVVRGLAQKEVAHTVWISFIHQTGQVIGEMVVPTTEGDLFWEQALIVPERLTGPVYFAASIRNENGEVVATQERPISLITEGAAGSYIEIYTPLPGDVGVGGHYFYMEGHVQQPAGSRAVTLSFWDEGCVERLARQSFNVSGSGRWWGFLIVPRAFSGTGCVQAEVGNPDGANWRGAIIPVGVLDRTTDEAKGIVVGAPPLNEKIDAGDEIDLYGVVYNSPDQVLLMTVLMDNGRVIDEQEIPIQSYGYWETTVIFPEDSGGIAYINLSTGEFDDDQYSQNQWVIEVEGE